MFYIRVRFRLTLVREHVYCNDDVVNVRRCTNTVKQFIYMFDGEDYSTGNCVIDNIEIDEIKNVQNGFACISAPVKWSNPRPNRTKRRAKAGTKRTVKLEWKVRLT